MIAVHLGRTKVMEIVADVYRRLGKELPDGRTAPVPIEGRPNLGSAGFQLMRRPANWRAAALALFLSS